MKKTYKISLLLLCMVLLLSFCSCGLFGKAKEKDSSKSGATITLTDEFTEQELVSQTAYYVSMKSIVTMLKEEFSLFKGTEYENMTLNEYAKLVITANSLTATAAEEDGLVYFTYEKSNNGKDYKYYATVFKGTDAYWLIQFACEVDDFDKFLPDFQKWAKSVKFS